MSEFLMKPRNDYAFKELMSVENVRIGFLSAILKLNPDDIKETHILNTDLKKMFPDDKLGILDVRLSLNDDTEIDIEVQISEVKVWAERSLFYLAKMYTEQIHPGEKYDVLKKCVSISILDFDLFKGETEFYSRFHIREDYRNLLFTDKMEFHVIELPKLPEKLKDSDDILLWAKFINAEKKEEFDMLSNRNEYIDSAYDHLKIISQDEKKRAEYEAREKAIRDHDQMMWESRETGKKEGIEIGRKEQAIYTAEELIKSGIATNIIAKSTGLSYSEVKELRNNR